MRFMLFFAMISAAFLAGGCKVMDAGKSIGEATGKLMTPNPGGYDDGSSTYTDDWSQYGSNARDDRPATRINDPINKFTTSDKAKSIERSVGIEYE